MVRNCIFYIPIYFFTKLWKPYMTNIIKLYLWVLVCIMRTLIRVAVKSHKLHFIPEFALAALLSSFFCKSKCIEDVGCSKIRTLCCSPPGLNLGWDIGLDGVTAASLTFFFGLAPDFGVASEIHQKYYILFFMEYLKVG